MSTTDPREREPVGAAADERRAPFLFGAQYYRAPTPEPALWRDDLRAMRDLGFNAVKYFLQWRWSHRAPDRYHFEDLDRLMDLAAELGLGVTLNFILDVSPVWLFDVCPDAKQVDSRGRHVEPYVVGHRQIGGHPGPCYRHPGALELRRRFLAASVEHFRGHAALQMWDVWNEPELSFPQRTPDLATMVCYCLHCERGFRDWLRRKYATVDRLDEVWGRCYERWEQVELPRGTGAYTDFVDWREFHLDTMAEEAAWRLESVRKLDPEHTRYLHVVPNCWFSAVTCADDFAMAERCEVFAATMSGRPEMIAHVVSAARGKVVYNVESHIDFGSTDMHQRVLGLDDVLRDLAPQVGAGVKGFLFWQYRSEVLGAEAPAWGLVRPDGSPRPVTGAVRRFWDTLRPHVTSLRRAFPPPAEVGVWRSRKNEIFHFCMQGSVERHNAAIAAYLEALYWSNLPHRLLTDGMLAEGELEGVRLLLMPSCYYLTQEQARSLDSWVHAGGVLVCEAHLAGYDGTSGRHSRRLPGCGLAESWGLEETESTSSRHLRHAGVGTQELSVLSDDVRKALASAGESGGMLFPIRLTDGTIVAGAHRYATLAGTDLENVGSFDGSAPCIARRAVGRGQVFYCGTNLGLAAAEGAPAVLDLILGRAAAAAGLDAKGSVAAGRGGTVHIDILSDRSGPRFAVVTSRAETDQRARVRGTGRWRGLFGGAVWQMAGETDVAIPAGFAEIFLVEGAPAGGGEASA